METVESDEQNKKKSTILPNSIHNHYFTETFETYKSCD